MKVAVGIAVCGLRQAWVELLSRITHDVMISARGCLWKVVPLEDSRPWLSVARPGILASVFVVRQRGLLTAIAFHAWKLSDLLVIDIEERDM